MSRIDRHNAVGRSIIARLAVELVLLGAVCLTASQAAAYDALDKLGRGFAGMTTSFLEVPGNIVAETRDHGAAQGIPVGFFKGLGMIVVRTPVGVYETLSAPIPAPAGYRPIIRPEYPWSYFGDGRKPERRAEIAVTPYGTAHRHDR
jgi:putative exosortase-associated protein (TIGR04073 family)